VTDEKVDGFQTATGNLASGFSITAGVDSIFVGDLQEVSVNWDLTVSDISFYFKDCKIEQGNSEVPIIKSGCYSEALQITPISDTAFMMKTFTIENETDFSQFVVCQIKLCMDDCDKPTNNEDCPADEHYFYSITGYIKP